MEFNPQHWAYIWGLGVFTDQSDKPGENGLIGFRDPVFDVRARRHYRLGESGFAPSDLVNRSTVRV